MCRVGLDSDMDERFFRPRERGDSSKRINKKHTVKERSADKHDHLIAKRMCDRSTRRIIKFFERT